MSGAMNYIVFLGATGEAALKPVKALYIVSTQTSPYPKFPNQTGQLVLFCKPPALQLKCCWATELPGVVFSPSGQMGTEDTLHGQWSYV